MLLPSKVTPYNASILAPMVTIAGALRQRPQTVGNLLATPTIKQLGVDVVFLCLDAMFALGKANLEKETGEITYVD